MTKLAIIPARGGSKRIPKKNIKKFFGKPIIAYSIEAAIKSNLFDEVMVSTDDSEIAEIAKKYGAKVPFLRSNKNADDHATTIEVIDEVLDNYKNIFDKTFEIACCIYPTAPFIQIQHLKEGLSKLIENNFSSVFPIVAFSYPVFRGVEIGQDGRVRMVWPEYQNSRSQDLKIIYHDAGQWYWFNALKINKVLFTDNTGSIILPEMEVQDIDTLADWKLAEHKYKMLENEKNNI
ncbi:MAG: pseudaminic acid cytidylyltransferase [Bacteroidota bacterium]